MKITYDEGVFEELVNPSSYLADRDEDIAHAFLDACDKTFQFLTVSPFAGSPRKFTDSRLADVRMWRVKGFAKYLIFYVPLDNGIRILHVLHSATDYNRAFDDE